MAERNVETEAKAVDELVERYDEIISRMASGVVTNHYFDLNYVNECLDALDTIERALSRLLNPLLKP